MTRRLSRNVDALAIAGASACKPERRRARGLAGREPTHATTFAVTMSLTESSRRRLHFSCPVAVQSFFELVMRVTRRSVKRGAQRHPR
jgi:hypothetical protein